jgi:outer membrane protein OmpA-like peptidoglycan-associated protein
MRRAGTFRLIAGAALAATAALASCGKPAPPATPPATAAADSDLQAAAAVVAKDLAGQMSAGVLSRKLVVDPLLDRSTGQQTGVSVRVQEEIVRALGVAINGAVIVPFDAKAVEASALVITGTVATVEAPDRYGISVAVTDRASGLVIAQSAARFRQAGLDGSPTPFYSDSPSLVRDRSVDGYVKTAETPAGSLADPLYVAQLPTAALIAAAVAAYNDGRWEEALSGYTTAASRAEGQTLRTFNGLYLCNIHLGRTGAAEEAFGKIALLGLATNNLAVKLLFRPGTTEFLADANLSAVYPMWLRQIGLATRASGSCLHIVGHTSRSGSEATNDRLSLARATVVRDLLEKEVPGLARKSRVSGEGFRKNIVGSGTDDARDALDRRVEFEVEKCGG